MNPNKTRYRTSNWHDSVRSRTKGRPKVYTDAAIQAILTLKVLFKLALRQALE
ncbi:MAG: transposase [Zoogloea sp.]|jgi:hypothetical protein|nr:transposase [Zoogloea sp.]